MKIQIAVLNHYAPLGAAEVKKVIAALQTQVSRDFSPAWGIDAVLKYYASREAAPKDSWQLVILDNTDQAGALGYHDLTPAGKPLGKVFAGTDIKNKESWTITASHELLEMLGDPETSLSVFRQHPDGSGVLYAFENCDACQDERHAYKINGISVSNFVYPSWFQDFHPFGTRYDHRKLISKPFEILPGGYIPTYQISAGQNWVSMGARTSSKTASSLVPEGSRRDRRTKGRHTWKKSKPGAKKKN
jgi:hypothetical protein